MIFELAYPCVDNLVLEFRQDLRKMRRIYSSAQHEFAPAPTPKVNEWLVSRRFFLAAAKAWIAAQHGIARDEYGAVRSVAERFFILDESRGLYLDNIRHATIGLHYHHTTRNSIIEALIQRCPKLKDFTLEVDPDFFALLEKNVLEDDLLECDIESVFTAQELYRVAHLDTFKLDARNCGYSAPRRRKIPGKSRAERHEIFLRNVDRLEKYIQQRKSSAKADRMRLAAQDGIELFGRKLLSPSSDPATLPLYTGSRVSLVPQQSGETD